MKKYTHNNNNIQTKPQKIHNYQHTARQSSFIYRQRPLHVLSRKSIREVQTAEQRNRVGNTTVITNCSISKLACDFLISAKR
jgi:hypothetical protein